MPELLDWRRCDGSTSFQATSDFGRRLQTSVVEVLNLPEDSPVSPSGFLSDGCEMCLIRELLFTLVPLVLDAQKEGLVSL